MEVNTVVKTIIAGAKAHKPEIMIGIGLAAGIGAIFVAAKETPVCLETFAKAEEEQPILQEEVDGEIVEIRIPLDFKTKAIIFAKSYWLAALLETLSIFFIVYGSKIRLDGYTALVALYGLTKAERDDLKKIIDAHPDNWKKKFNEKAAEIHMAETTPEDIPEPRMSNTEVPMPLPLFWDDQAKVYFRMTEEELRDAVAEFTSRVTSDPFQAATINDWMEIIGHEDIRNGDYDIMNGSGELKYGPLKYHQIGVKEAPNKEPCRMMKFNWDYCTDTRVMYDNV